MKITRGTFVEVISGPAKGAEGVAVRRSRASGLITVVLLAPFGAYKKGDALHVYPYEARPLLVARP